MFLVALYNILPPNLTDILYPIAPVSNIQLLHPLQLDSAVPEKLCLMSRDEQSVLVVSYAELKQCFMVAFSELLQSSQSSQSAAGFS